MTTNVDSVGFKSFGGFNEFTYPNNNFILNMILDRIHGKNQNFVAVFTGETGSGKSWSALRLGELLMAAQGRKLDVNNIVFDAEDFKRKNAEKMQKGEVIIFDEAGVTWESHTALSSLNRELKKIMMTNRFKNLIYFITLPLFGSLDKSGRSLSHYSFQCDPRSVDKKEGLNYVKPKRLVINHFEMNEGIIGIYEKYRFRNQKMKCTHIILKKPSVPLLRSYEEHKINFVNKLDRSVIDVSDDVPLGYADPDFRNPKVMLDPEQLSVYELFEANPAMSREDVCRVLGRTPHWTGRQINLIRKKGFECPPGLREKTQEYIVMMRNKKNSKGNVGVFPTPPDGDNSGGRDIKYKEMEGDENFDQNRPDLNFLTI